MGTVFMDVATVLLAVSEELSDLSIETDDLGVSSVAGLERLQHLDRVGQHMGELARFLSALSALVPAIRRDLGPALAAVHVGAVADRLAGRVRAPCEDCETGSLLLFEE